MAYTVSQAADADIDALFDLGIDLFGQAQAENYVAGLIKTLEFLASFPRAARLRDDLPSPIRAYPYKAHLILYDIDDTDDIVIVRVRHGHEDWQTHPL